jgi:hypothetical protein
MADEPNADWQKKLVTKNTFLDCESPWQLEMVNQPEKPKSDPGSQSMSQSRTSSFAELPDVSREEATDSDATGNDPSQDEDAANNAVETVFVSKTRTQRRREQRKILRATFADTSKDAGGTPTSTAGQDGKPRKGNCKLSL